MKTNPKIDPEDRSCDIRGELQNPAAATYNSAMPRPRGRRKYRRWLGALAVVLGGVVWLNGPGLRWLAPMVAARYVERAGAHIKFTLEGTLTGGLAVNDLHLEGYQALASLTVNRVAPVYRFKELLHGRIEGITIDGLCAELRLGQQDPTPDSEEKKPLDLEKLVQTLHAVRDQIIPLSVDLKNISIKVTRDGKPVIALAPSRLHHRAGDSSFPLELGVITDTNGRQWPGQQSNIEWSAVDLAVQRIDPMPGVSVRDLVLRLPARGGPSAAAAIHIADAVLVATAAPGFSSVSVDLREGHLHSEPVAACFALQLPAQAALTSLAIHLNGLLPDPMAATGTARMSLEDVVAGDWKIPVLSLAVELEAAGATVAATGRMLGSGFSIHAAAPITRGGGLSHAVDVRGRIQVAEFANLVGGLAEHTSVIDPAAVVPPSTVDGDFSLVWKDRRPGSAEVNLVLQPADPQAASSVRVSGQWQPEHALAAQLEIEGVQATADYNLASATYQGEVAFSNFSSARIDRWLASVGADTRGALALTGKWHGSGDVGNAAHRGSLALDRAEWQRAGGPPVTADGGIDYTWPGDFTTTNLRLQANHQTIAGDAKLTDGLLELANLRWLDGTTEIAGGSASLPVPEDFSKWRDTLARDRRPLAIALESKVLSLAMLKDWLPAAGLLDPRSTGQIHLQVSGTYAEPVVDAVLEAGNLRSPTQPKLPPADLKVTLAGRDGRLTVEGNAKAADFPAAVMTAAMPFRPAAWAENPALLGGEKISARLDLPRIDLARFAALVPSARQVSGFLTGRVEVTGEASKPVVTGNLDLTGGSFALRDDRHPPVTGIAASVDLALDRITLKTLQATIAGGTLQAGGSLMIAAGKPGALDLRATGNHLPVLRNDSLIIRANADLRLTGNWDHATLAGSVAVVDSLFYRDIELIPIGTPFTTPAAAELPKLDAPANPAVAMPEPIRNWTLNVLARTENPFLIRGNLATGRMDGSVRIGGTIGNPAPAGEVQLSDFSAALPFSTLHVRSGTARFSPATGFDPELEIRGTAEPRPYQVNGYVYGRASNPQLVLTSNPPLPDNEIMTLLATGTTTSGLENPQAASSRALQLLAEELRRGRFAVGKQLRPLLGLLDRVDFSLAETDPYSSAAYSTATLTLTDHWLLSAGLGAEGDSRVLAVWRVTFR